MRIASPSRGIAIALAAAVLFSVPALAEHTRWWRQNSFEDLDKGVAKGVAIRSDGKLFLAPRFTQFADANLAFVLALRTDSKGNLYAAGGSNAKVLRFDAAGKATTVFESAELAAQTIALDASGNLYVGTSPDGKVYKVTPAGQSSVFFDPKTKYIWDLAIDRDGTLYVATGDTGKIFVVTPDGKGQVFYSSEETHVRALAIDTNGNILAGTEPSGLVLRIPKAADAPAGRTASSGSGDSGANPRRAFVLYETSKKEVTALLRDASGNLYVASVGEKSPSSSVLPRTQNAEPVAPAANFSITIGPGLAPQQAAPGQPVPFLPTPSMNSSSVYRIATDGSPEELWSSPDEIVYALGFVPDGKLLLGTGNQGAVLELEGNQIFSRLVKTTSGQATSIVSGPGGKLFVATGNPGKVYALGPDSEPEGTYESQAFDARTFSRWGRLEWWGGSGAPKGASAGTSAKNPASARIDFYARSGNTSDPNNDWSPWAGPYSNPSGDTVECPAARFVQWKAVLHGAANGPTPELDWVNIAYLPKNLPPSVTGIAIQNPGIRAGGPSFSVAASQLPVQLRPPQSTTSFNQALNVAAANDSGSSQTPEIIPQGVAQKGYQTVLWTAEDPNNDQLEFAVYYRSENETMWKLLKDKLDTRFYSWDTTGMPDGAYYLKILASDAPSNSPGEALTAERESDRFVVDNTPPAVLQLTAEAAGTGGVAIRVRFQANDTVSSIARAQYSLDSGDWTLVSPTGGLSDAPRESYDFQLQKVAPGEHTITVRVYDEFENVSSADAAIRVSPSGN